MAETDVPASRDADAEEGAYERHGEGRGRGWGGRDAGRRDGQGESRQYVDTPGLVMG